MPRDSSGSAAIGPASRRSGTQLIRPCAPACGDAAAQARDPTRRGRCRRPRRRPRLGAARRGRGLCRASRSPPGPRRYIGCSGSSASGPASAAYGASSASRSADRCARADEVPVGGRPPTTMTSLPVRRGWRPRRWRGGCRRRAASVVGAGEEPAAAQAGDAQARCRDHLRRPWRCRPRRPGRATARPRGEARRGGRLDRLGAASTSFVVAVFSDSRSITALALPNPVDPR